MVQKVEKHVPKEQLEKDLEAYRRRAVEMGATDAKIITTDDVIIDERVRAKCIYPKCLFYNTSAHCPPHSLDLDATRRIVNQYTYAVFTRIQTPSEELAGREAKKKGTSRFSHLKTYEIVSKIEAQAFFDGYHLTLGFACGPCKKFFCEKHDCSALIPGQPCRHPLRSRGSMEGVGMDVFSMATRAGWDVYPIGASIDPSEVPFGSVFGIVLIY